MSTPFTVAELTINVEPHEIKKRLNKINQGGLIDLFTNNQDGSNGSVYTTYYQIDLEA